MCGANLYILLALQGEQAQKFNRLHLTQYAPFLGEYAGAGAKAGALREVKTGVPASSLKFVK